jgi:hypothetical protein|tara:strand:- start:44872 stop:45018 length:147 start_codon:yes stop_codon:yes gene_type:complete
MQPELVEVALSELTIISQYTLNLLATLLVEFASDVSFYVFGVQNENSV